MIALCFVIHLLKADSLTVCEALERSSELDGTMVVIRGEWVTGGEMSELRTDSCDLSDKEKAVWPRAITLSSPALSDRPLDIKVDRESFVKFREAVTKLLVPKGGAGEYRIIGTFRGQLQFKRQLRAYRDAYGNRRFLGYGHGGHYPAQLVCLSVSDPAVELKPKPANKSVPERQLR